MIKPEIIEKLKTYNNSSFQILSVYLGSDEVQSPSGEFLLKQFHSLLHQHLNKDLRATFESDITRIEEYLSDYKPLARSLIFFSAGSKLWDVEELEYFLPIGLSVENSPNLEPIIHSLQKYTKYLVLLVDREKARIFTVEQGEINDHTELFDDQVPQKVKSTGRVISGGNSDTMFRHNELLLQRHIELAAKTVAKFTESMDIEFVIIGGHAEIFKKVIKSLPASLRDKVTGSFVTELNIPLSDILLESKIVAANIKQ
jgi:peptide subunit release factor 1 (eRF1)